MSINRRRQKQASILRFVRKVHRILGITLFVFFIIVGITGLLLGWKKNSNGAILPNAIKGTSTDLADWKPLNELKTIALVEARRKMPKANLSRIDVRESKGMAKFIFDKNQLEIQLDGKSGEVLQTGRRYSDLLENIHDGSIVDDWLGLSKGLFKLIYTSILGLALIGFSLTGFWLWYGPKKMRKLAKK